jgi:hypothetical protein
MAGEKTKLTFGYDLEEVSVLFLLAECGSSDVLSFSWQEACVHFMLVIFVVLCLGY